ncbi:MAG TPA: DUF445 domain-containing protein [Acidimicrobiia bacterium]|nr:DUF445 domain-containing protein [Acidimicrobiia bacterium]
MATGLSLGSEESYEARRVRELRRWQRRANGFLLGALVVFLISHLLFEEGRVNGWIMAASEAALIGGIADWFAVTALFRHPLGIPIPHTALIPESKDAIGRGLAEFVQQNFLEPTNLRQWLTSAGIARRVASWLDSADHSALAARRSIETAATLALSIDDERVASVITKTSLDWMRQTSVTPFISLVVDAWLKDGRTRESIEASLRGIEVVLVDNLPYFRASFAKSAPWWVPSWAGDIIFERIIASFQILVDDVASDPTHPIRSEIDAMLARLADNLRNSADLADRIEESKLRLLESPELAAAIKSQWQLLHASLDRAAGEPGSELEQRLAELIQWWARRVLDDGALRMRIDGWIAQSAERLAYQWDEEVIGLIETTVAGWDPTEISHRLELQLGPDLQFVRINGTVVGALVGIAMYGLLLLVG